MLYVNKLKYKDTYVTHYQIVTHNGYFFKDGVVYDFRYRRNLDGSEYIKNETLVINPSIAKYEDGKQINFNDNSDIKIEDNALVFE